MTPERWEVIQRVLEAVLELEPTRRAAFLDDACLGDPSLRPEVERVPLRKPYLKQSPCFMVLAKCPIHGALVNLQQS
jgi:hypothetical protein